MKKIIFWLSGLLLSVSGVAQVTADIGLWGGGASYWGDMEGNTVRQLSFPTAGGYFRYNFNPRVSARAMFLYGANLKAEGTFLDADYSFADKNIGDLSLQVEINYYRYTLGNKKASFTSYLTAGAGTMFYRYYPETDNRENFDKVVAPTIPFGMGVKFNAGKRLGLGLEYQIRKIFDDRLDDLDNPLADNNPSSGGVAHQYTDRLHNNDWTGFLGLHVTYKIYLGNRPCPAFEAK